MNYKHALAALISDAAGLNIDDTQSAIEIPADSAMGDFAYPCFRLAKAMKKAPPAIAADLAKTIAPPDFIAEIKATGPYLNFFLNREKYAATMVSQMNRLGADFGRSDMGGGRCVVIDYSSPNVAKPFHIGHMRSTNIGAALYKIYNFLGYSSFGINFIGDWGTQFGKIITAYKLWGDHAQIQEGGMDALLALYVKFHEEADKDPALDEAARGWFVKMEQGDPEAMALWHWISDISMADYEIIYKRLGNITFDSFNGESFYNDKMAAVVDELRDCGIMVESDGAMIVDLENHKMPPCLILKRDGSTLYPTRDIASAFYRKKEYNFHKAIYVTGQEQILHFAQWFKVVELMGHKWADDLVHVPFGMLNFGQEKMSTRRGRVLKMSDLLDRAVNKISEIIETKNPGLANKEQIAEAVGIGAIKFADLYNNRIKDIEFNWDRMLNFDGETGPYVQYTHARCASVLTKADIDFKNPDFALLSNDDEFALIKALAAFPDKIIESAKQHEPYILARHIMAIAQAYNKFYHDNPILRAEPALKSARLGLTAATKNIIASGLDLLGIAAPNEM
ncbi:MAG: arginine--tRNA ligase [Defluviitaleaceae bacterium]|nr:arginine--tRNA ligase [Defluviitaleaceae bacterium]